MAEFDLGGGFSYRFYQWAPERDLNPQYADVPDVEHAGIILTCRHGTDGGVPFKVPDHRLFTDGWDVISEQPLELAPSILRTECGCHGFIRAGEWVDA